MILAPSLACSGSHAEQQSKLMSAFAQPSMSRFAVDVAEGLSAEPRSIPSRYLCDKFGLSLLETISKQPEFGLAQAEERILRRNSQELAQLLSSVSLVSKLSGEGNRAAALVVRSLSAWNCELRFRPLSTGGTLALKAGEDLGPDDWLEGAARISGERENDRPILLMLLGRSFGTLDRLGQSILLKELRALMRSGDYLLIAADLVKSVDKMLSTYDDPTGLMAAFNKNLLTRINRELGGHFNPRLFAYKARWNAFMRRMELLLEARQDHEVYISCIGNRYRFQAGDIIQTEFAYKLTELELEGLPISAGFKTVKTWNDIEWAFAETLWTV
jgi:L-histidine Nalpha-methyltransferase